MQLHPGRRPVAAVVRAHAVTGFSGGLGGATRSAMAGPRESGNRRGAQVMHLGEGALRTRIADVLRKLDCDSLAEGVDLARRHQLIR